MVFISLAHSLAINGQSDTIHSGLALEMDFRFRMEHDWNSLNSDGSEREDRSRLRYRLRTGMTYNSRSYSFGFRIRTGAVNKQQDPQLTLGKGLGEFATLPIGFERIFFQYAMDNHTFWLGKNTYPFEKNNELFWSDNVFPEGVFIEKIIPIKNSQLRQLKVSAGHFILASNDGSFLRDAYFQGIQLGIKTVHDWINIFPSLYRFKNIPDIPDGGHRFLLNYTILHLGTKVYPDQSKKFCIDFDFYHNLESYSGNAFIDQGFKNQKTGYTIGLQFGTIENMKDWFVKLTYAHLERYAILDYMAQNDWARWSYASNNSPDGRLSNLKGLELVFAYSISEKITLVSKYYTVKQLLPYGITRETGQRIRFDIDIRL